MTHLDYITTDVKALSLNDTIKKAKQYFAGCTLSHLPVVKKKQLIGLLPENDIQCIDADNDKIEAHLDILSHFFTSKKSVWIDLLKQFATEQCNLIPVVDNNLYLGYYELNDVLHQFLETPFLNENGILIIVEKNTSEYSFSEISQIIESNNARLLGAFITNREGDNIQIMLKISEHDINNTLQTFRRYNYNIVVGNLEDKFLDELKERSEYLQKYLNI